MERCVFTQLMSVCLVKKNEIQLERGEKNGKREGDRERVGKIWHFSLVYLSNAAF